MSSTFRQIPHFGSSKTIRFVAGIGVALGALLTMAVGSPVARPSVAVPR